MSTDIEMRAFVAVVEGGSFSAAAAALGLTPSAVSKLVGRLEDRLGVRLLFRTTRRLTLTSEGELFLARSRQILADIEEAEAEIAKFCGAPRGRLGVNTSNAVATHQLAPVLPEFFRRYPDIQIELSVTDRIVDLVEEQADVAIRTGRIGDTALSARKITDVEWTICAAPAYLKGRDTPRAAADLATHSCIIFSAAAMNRWPFRAPDGSTEYVEIVPRIATDNAETALRLALDGAGIARLGDLIVGEAIGRKLLVPLLTDSHDSEPQPLSALYRAGRHRLPKVRVFLDYLTEKFSGAPWRITGADQSSRPGTQRRNCD